MQIYLSKFDVNIFQAFRDFFFKNCILISLREHMYKAHQTIHKMLSQGNFRKILKFVIGHVIKYNQLK
jgi:hypothetical protein